MGRDFTSLYYKKLPMKKHNFSAGPSILPQEVVKKAAEAVINFNDLGLSLIEISHRSKDFVAVMDEACALALELLGLENKGYKAIFLQGGASTQFLMAAYNLLERKAGYLNTGTWSSKALKEAKLLGKYWNWHLPKIRTSITSQKISIFPPISTIFIVLATIRSSGHKFINFPKLRSPWFAI